MLFAKPVITTNDLEIIHKTYLSLQKIYPDNSVRRNYFLAACSLFNGSTDFDFDIAMKLRPYGGLIGLDNSSMDRFLKDSKILRLHAILHDAAGYIQEYYKQGPGYAYMLPCDINSPFAGHITGIAFCWYTKLFKPITFHLLEC